MYGPILRATEVLTVCESTGINEAPGETGMEMRMKEPYIEEVATHDGPERPEPCVGDPRGRSPGLDVEILEHLREVSFHGRPGRGTYVADPAVGEPLRDQLDDL